MILHDNRVDNPDKSDPKSWLRPWLERRRPPKVDLLVGPPYREDPHYDPIAAQLVRKERITEICSRPPPSSQQMVIYEPLWKRSAHQSYTRLAYDKLFKDHVFVDVEQKLLICYTSMVSCKKYIFHFIRGIFSINLSRIYEYKLMVNHIITDNYSHFTILVLWS